MTPTSLVNQYSENGVNFPILGHLCWWTVHNIQVTRDRLIQLLKAANIDKKFARSHNYRAAFIRALKEFEENRIIRLVEEDGNRLIYQFTAEDKVDNAQFRLVYNPETVVAIDKDQYRKTQDISLSITGREDIKQKLISLFDEKKDNYFSSDVTRLIQRIFREKADIVSLREQGSVYFVPFHFSSLLNAVATFVNSINGATFELFPLPDVEACRNTVGTAVNNEMRIDLEKMEKEMIKVENGEKEVTQRWRNHKLKTIENIRKRITRYVNILDVSSHRHLTDKFEAMKQSILKPRVLDI